MFFSTTSTCEMFKPCRRRAIWAQPAKEVANEVQEVRKVEEPKALLGRPLCPKCKVKPAHFFHVRSCKGA